MSCQNISNISKSQCYKDYGQVVGVWLDRDDTGVTLANALLEATWTAKIKAAQDTRMYVLNPKRPHEVTRNVAEPVIATGNTGDRIQIRSGNADYTFTWAGLSLEKAAEIKSLNGGTFYTYFLTSKEWILGGGTSTQLEPVECQIFVSEYKTAETQDTPGTLSVNLFIVPTEDYFVNAVAPNQQDSGNWKPSQVNGIRNVVLTVISSDVSDKTVIFDVNDTDGNEVSTIVTYSNFLVELTSTGADATLVSISNVGNRYTLITDVGALSTAAHRISMKESEAQTGADAGLFETRSNKGAIVYTAFTPVA